jgi:hypothetical protein
MLGGCSRTARDLKLDADLARASLNEALKAWADGKHPEELAPEIIVGDASWNAGQTLVSFEIKSADERSDGATSTFQWPASSGTRRAKSQKQKPFTSSAHHPSSPSSRNSTSPARRIRRRDSPSTHCRER